MPRCLPRRFSLPQGEPQLPRVVRRATGVYYTPPEVVREIVSLTLAPLLENGGNKSPRILDPACGAGAFLVEALRTLLERQPCPLATADRLALAKAAIFGVDIDPRAATATRQALAALVAESADPIVLDEIANSLAGNILTADALLSQPLDALGPFDAVVGNPPYVNIRQLAKSRSADEIRALRGRFRTARGSFDLYVLFLERALELLRPGGRCGMIVPNKWAGLDYAKPCREMLHDEATLERIIDLADERVFREASVYPQVLILTSGRGIAGQAFVPATPQTVPAVESRVKTMPLGQLARLACGTTGFAATRIARKLVEADDCLLGDTPAADFITSGNIDRYRIRLGNVRYLHRTYVRPRLPLEMPELSAAKRKLFAGPKIVIAGLSQRIEAAWDDRGLALGVQVFAASQPLVHPHYLLAVLNSKLLSYLFRARFAAKRLAGGYLAINKGQLAQLPIVVGQDLPFTEQLPAGHSLLYEPSQAEQMEIDRRVYALYRLSQAEVDEVERQFMEPAARAA
jgi:SAM-dependent methyltransferase